MTGIVPGGVFDAAIDELRRRSKLKLYQTDFDAWAWDVLRMRNYKKMREIAWDMLFAPKERTLTKSGNGVGKSALMSQCVLWAGSVWPEGDTVSIISAPSIPQLQKVTFKYLKEYHGRVSETLTPASFRVPGRIDENLGWVAETKSGKIWLATGRKPPDQDAVSMFQGLRSPNGMTYVWFDEAGGMSRDMYTAAEAVQTGDAGQLGNLVAKASRSRRWRSLSSALALAWSDATTLRIAFSTSPLRFQSPCRTFRRCSRCSSVSARRSSSWRLRISACSRALRA